jgi:hypothetical protein
MRDLGHAQALLSCLYAKESGPKGPDFFWRLQTMINSKTDYKVAPADER